MMSILLQLLLFLIIFIRIFHDVESGNIRESLFMNGRCQLSQFRCFNDACIDRKFYCDGSNNCGDNSDEQYCSVEGSCSVYNETFTDCSSDGRYSHKCIPYDWNCDEFQDCPFNNEGENCDIYSSQIVPDSVMISKASYRAMKWILLQRNNQTRTTKWGINIPRIAVALSLCYSNFMKQGNYADEITYELNLSLLSKLALKKIEDITTSEIALYVNAFLLNCINPRKFYVVDLVKELRKRVDESNSTNPAALLALCNAQEIMTETDVMKLAISFWEAGSHFRIDSQALIIMVLACAKKQNMVDQENLSELLMELKKKQYRNGTVENFKTTALVMQAIFASESQADEDNFDEKKAIQEILNFQEEDGSFGNFLNTYYVLPVLNYLSFVNISSAHCSFASKDETEGLQYLKDQLGEKWNVKFSIWIGEGKVLQRSIALSVPANTSFYGIMEYASDLDDKYKFQYNVRKTKPYVFALSGIMDEAEMETYWLPYFISNETSGELKPIITSVADVYPKQNDHLVFWYKKDTLKNFSST